MSNPIYEELKRVDKVKDITEIDNIVEVYIQSNGKYLDLDKARKKIQELQKKDEIIFAMTAPKPGMPSTPWECTNETQLCASCGTGNADNGYRGFLSVPARYYHNDQ